jgi:hypothetical protein
MSGVSVRDVVFLIRARKHTASGIWLPCTHPDAPAKCMTSTIQCLLVPTQSYENQYSILHQIHLILIHNLPALNRTIHFAARSIESYSCRPNPSRQMFSHGAGMARFLDWSWILRLPRGMSELIRRCIEVVIRGEVWRSYEMLFYETGHLVRF